MIRPECEQHHTPARDNQYRATARYYKDSCPYCEIDSLKEELEDKTQMYEELYDHHFKEHHTTDYARITELEQQLQQARREADSSAKDAFRRGCILPKPC